MGEVINTNRNYKTSKEKREQDRKYRERHRAELHEYDLKYKQKNKEKIYKQNALYRLKNKKDIAKYNGIYYDDNSGKIKERSRNDFKQKKHDEEFKMKRQNYQSKKYREDIEHQKRIKARARANKIPINNKVCETCGRNSCLTRHHDDYSRPFCFKVLCEDCHASETNKMKQEKRIERRVLMQSTANEGGGMVNG